ncbi:ABC transporter [Paenibacillus sp. yr247]|uniref:ATP-binding cassette domain-containing protein n=1 Tax=Paenibacillus sp. yr247 TaxID=1761880 RepID=UPI000887ABCD|nr:ATP-binding cassette domain-containing protein [Paenibacillus sp. yr247]SDN01530.1 ABC transporter [Paenibacillus sp. yr247]
MNSDLSQQKVEISVDSVSMVFGKKGRQVTVLQDISFGVWQNEFVSLLGPSGCGKSTLLRLMAYLSKSVEHTLTPCMVASQMVPIIGLAPILYGILHDPSLSRIVWQVM